jgi:hypothetical protein
VAVSVLIPNTMVPPLFAMVALPAVVSARTKVVLPL